MTNHMDSRRQPVAHLIFPAADPYDPCPAQILVRLSSAEITLILERMTAASRLEETLSGLQELAFGGPNSVYKVGRPHQGPLRPGGVALRWVPLVHPDIAREFDVAVSGHRLKWHVNTNYLVYLAGELEDRRVFTVEATLWDLMVCRLLTAPDRSVPRAFAELVGEDAWEALDILEQGVMAMGGPPLRNIAAHLRPQDLASLLSSPESDERERAMQCLGRLRAGKTSLPGSGATQLELMSHLTDS
jgi:hypothetical protein